MTGIPTLGPQSYSRVAETEYSRFAGLLNRLTPAEWMLPTGCPPWNVRQLVAHVVGATEANASPREMLRQLRRGRHGVAIRVDEVNSFQVAERDHAQPAELISRFSTAARAAVRWRRRMALYLGWVPLRVGAPVHETWRVGYLAGVIYTRDTWMHRIDICRATHRAPHLSADHDALVVADVVAEWGARHGRDVLVRLTGTAGGEYRLGDGGRELNLDAIDFCRLVSGRGEPPLATPVPF